jgi:hypothetical protein
MDQGLSLPSHNGLSSDAVGHIAVSLEEFLQGIPPSGSTCVKPW